MSWTSSLSSLRASIVPSVRRALQYINVLDHDSDGNDFRLWPSIVYARLQRYFGSKLQYVIFVSVLLFFFTCSMLTIGNEMSVDEYRASFQSAANDIQSVLTDGGEDIVDQHLNITLLESANFTLFQNSTDYWNSTDHNRNESIPISTPTGDSPEISPSPSFLASLMIMLILWYSLIQLYRFLSYNAAIRASEGANREAERDNLRMIQQLMILGRTPSNRLRLAFLNRDFTSDDYEILRSLDDSVGSHGIEQSTIDRLPVHTVTAEDVLSLDGDADNMCSICLAPYEEGEEVRIVMCMHKFHKRCVDPWLRTNPTCPVCKNRAVE